MNNNSENTELEQLLDPKELAAAFEHTMNFVKGDAEALPDVLQHSGRLLLKLSRRLSTTQMILLVGALTLGAIFVAKRVEETLEDVFEDEDDTANSSRKALGSGSASSSQGNRSSASAANQSNASDNKSTGANSGQSGKQNSNSDSDKKSSDSNGSSNTGK